MKYVVLHRNNYIFHRKCGILRVEKIINPVFSTVFGRTFSYYRPVTAFNKAKNKPLSAYIEKAYEYFDA
jgi:hypothetical protein